MSVMILATKLHFPLTRSKVVHRRNLLHRLNEGRQCKLMLVCAPAGFGKTTLVSEWAASCEYPTAWLSLDSRDNDTSLFLMYVAAALQTIVPHIGNKILSALQSPQTPPVESLLTGLLNDLVSVSHDIVLVLDDYHVIESLPVNQALTFLIEHLPTHIHLVIVTRENPSLPLARYRAKGELTELRAADLRFSVSEAAEFLNRVMALNLSEGDIATLEHRTEGWIAGLQMAALSMQGRHDTASFIQSFTGSHHFILDYLVEEVLQRQPAHVQRFLLCSSLLDRLCGPLCDAVLRDEAGSGQKTLEYLEHANLFIFSLDNERHWYRYHHLFADLLRQRLRQQTLSQPQKVHELHSRASHWYKDNGLPVEAFYHAVAAHDVDRAAHLIEDDTIPLHFRGIVTTVLDWLESLPVAVLDVRPSLLVKYATLMLVVGQTTGVEEKLQAGEAALQKAIQDERTRDLIGQIAAARATLALTQYRLEDTALQSRRALDHLSARNLSFRASAHWTLGCAYGMRGQRAVAGQTFQEAINLGEAAGDTFTILLVMTGLGQVQEAENNLHQAADTYQRILQMAGDQPLQIIYEAYLGLGRIHYEWNNLELAHQYGQQSVDLARQYDRVIDRYILCEIFLARVMLAQGDIKGAENLLRQTYQSVHQRHFIHRISEVAAAQVLLHLHQGQRTEAAQLAHAHDLPLSQARVALAQGHAIRALTLLDELRQRGDTTLHNEQLTIMVLESVALYAAGQTDQALQKLKETLRITEAGGFIRLFVDEGVSMQALLHTALSQGLYADSIQRLLMAFPNTPSHRSLLARATPSNLIDPLSDREIEVLQLMAEGLTNQEIATRLYLSLHTVKVHVRHINAKLGASNRTQAVARGRSLNILSS